MLGLGLRLRLRLQLQLHLRLRHRMGHRIGLGPMDMDMDMDSDRDMHRDRDSDRGRARDRAGDIPGHRHRNRARDRTGDIDSDRAGDRAGGGWTYRKPNTVHASGEGIDQQVVAKPFVCPLEIVGMQLRLGSRSCLTRTSLLCQKEISVPMQVLKPWCS